MDRHEGHGAERDETGKPGKPGKPSELGPDTCAAFEPLLESLYYRALEPEEAQSVAKHVAGCASCGAALERLAATDRLIAQAPAPLPGPELRQRVAARIAAARMARSAGMAPSSPAERETVVSDRNDMSDMNDSRWTDTGTRQAPTRGRRLAQRMRVWLGTAAAVLIVTLLASVFLTRAHGTATPSQTHTGHSSGLAGSASSAACNPSKIAAHLPAHAYLYALAMVSPSEGWAVGSIQDNQDNGPVNSLVLHYKNCAWTPVATNYPNATLTSVSMDSAQDGWAVGGDSGSGPLALHFTNGAWTQETLPGENSLKGSYDIVRMLSASEGWMVVSYQKNTQGYGSQGLLHFANGRWSQAPAPFSMVNDVLPAGQDEAWVAGLISDRVQTPVLYHYQAGKWTAATVPHSVVIDQLRMVSPNNIWASGHVNAATNWDVDQSSAVLHYDGATWTQVNNGKGGNAQIVQAFDTGAAWAFTLQNTPKNAGWGFVISGVQYGGGDTWQKAAWPFTDLWRVHSLTRASADDYWAIGFYEVTESNSNGNGTAGHAVPVLLYFGNGAWHEYGR